MWAALGPPHHPMRRACECLCVSDKPAMGGTGYPPAPSVRPDIPARLLPTSRHHGPLVRCRWHDHEIPRSAAPSRRSMADSASGSDGLLSARARFGVAVWRVGRDPGRLA
jgi:hypothetical protein